MAGILIPAVLLVVLLVLKETGIRLGDERVGWRSVLCAAVGSLVAVVELTCAVVGAGCALGAGLALIALAGYGICREPEMWNVARFVGVRAAVGLAACVAVGAAAALAERRVRQPSWE